MRYIIMWWIGLLLILSSCNGNTGQKMRENLNFLAESETVAAGDIMETAPLGNFDADSAYTYLARQVEFGPRVPNSEAHKATGDWLVTELRKNGVKVTEQKADIKAFDGTILKARNIFGQYNPEKKNRILLLAHWDSRPWADQDPDASKRKLPVDGANDGASGVAVLLELTRQLSINPIDKGIDILFVDAEDWGTEGDDESWALGTRYFVENPPLKNYSPQGAILLDMVGGEGAIFPREYFSERYASRLNEVIWQSAHNLGYKEIFTNRLGGAITDDHVELIKAGTPAIDIVEFHPDRESGFNSRWHTTHDNLDGISKSTLDAVGKTLSYYIYNLL